MEVLMLLTFPRASGGDPMKSVMVATVHDFSPRKRG